MTILYLYYNQPEAIKFLKSLGYDKLHRKFLFVDDASKKPLQMNWADVIRILIDVPWNQPYANNIALKYLDRSETVLRMDIDHYFMPEDFDRLEKIKVGKNEIVHFKRGNLTVHPNIFLTNVGDLLDAGGYNENFCGNYGYDDRELMQRLKSKKWTFRTSDIDVRVNKKAGQHGLKRDTLVNYNKYLELQK